MKERSWFVRLLSVYLPIFYLAIVFLGFVFFMTMSQIMNSHMVRSNETYARNIMQTIESSLQTINQMIIREIHVNEDLQKFLYLENHPDINEHLLHSKLSQKFSSFMVNFPLIDSIYYYRMSDQKVLSSSALLPMEYFGDRDFVERLADGEMPYPWTSVRPFRLFANEEHPRQVISLVKNVPLLSDGNGFLVVNVSTKALEHMVREWNTQEISYTAVYDQEGNLILSTGEEAGDELSVIVSDYAGWEVRSGLRESYNYGMISDFYYGWLILGLVFIGLGTAAIVFFARKYTSPIDSMLNRIRHYSKSRSTEFPEWISDHPRFIERMVDHLIEIANQYSDIHQENLLYRRKQLFIDWVGGERALERETWEKEMAELGLETDFSVRYAAVAEIQQYEKMCEKYNDRDQYLFKYVIESVFQEIGTESDVSVWTEWLDPGRLTVLLQYRSAEADAADQHAVSLCERARSWIAQNTEYIVTVGIGSGATEWNRVPASLEEAEKALLQKPIDGNATIAYWEAAAQGKHDTLNCLHAVHCIAEGFKRRNETWEKDLIRFADEMLARLTVRQDVDHMIQYLLFHLANAFTELPATYKEIWDQTEIRLKEELKHYGSIEELRDLLLKQMRRAAEEIEKLRKTRRNQEILQQVKEYIEEHYNDPNLSLGLLSERFHMNQSYMSRLFKEEFGENFVDYLAKRRISRSKALLETTDCPLQDIALQVGYLYTFTFNRVFKRIVGLTPGEYRKQAWAQVQAAGERAALEEKPLT